ILLDDARRLRSRLESDVTHAHGTTTRELDAIEDAPHRLLGLATDDRPESLVMSESPLHDRPHAEPDGDVDAEVTVEPLKRREFVRQVHRPMQGADLGRTFGSRTLSATSLPQCA